MSNQRALITGITGQDGSYLAEFLLGQGYEVHGLVRHSSTERMSRLTRVRDRLHLHSGDIQDESSLREAVRSARPNEVYNLAAMSFVGTSWRHPTLTAELSGVAVTRLLEVIKDECPDTRFYQASSSEIFGEAQNGPQDEYALLHPRSPYGVAKAYGHFITVNYRESYGLHASSGILFNHESPRRGREFVTRRITHGAAAIRLGLQSELTLGNTEARRDWGYAGDYVAAMWMMLRRDEPDDFVIGTGVAHSVADVVAIAFDHVGLNSEEYVRVDPRLIRPAEVDCLLADPSKARAELGWRPRVAFEDLIRMMVDADLALLEDRAPTATAQP